MTKRLFCLLIVVSFLLVSVTAFAQPEERMKPGAISPAFKGKIDSATLKLNGIESQIAKIDRQKIVTIGDAENL